MMIFFQKILFPEEFAECADYIPSYSPKLISCLELVSCANFLHISP